MRLLKNLRRRFANYCDASNTMWLICRATRPWQARWCMWGCLAASEVVSLLPPPRSTRVLSLRWIRLVAWAALATLVTVANLYKLMTDAQSFMTGFSSISRVSFLASTIMTAIQPVVVLANNALHLSAAAPFMAGLLMPPLRFHPSFTVACFAMTNLLAAKHILYAHSGRKHLIANVLELFASVITLTFDCNVIFLSLCARDKLQDVNMRLSVVDRVRPGLRSLVLETAARQYELTADQVAALGGIHTLGLPLACNSIRHRVKLVTDSFLVYRSLERLGSANAGTTTALVLQLAAGFGRIFCASLSGDAMYRESKKTRCVLGAVDTVRWPEPERLLVQRLLRNSDRGVRWSMGGLASMDHSFLLSVIGSTATYLVVLMQYKDPAVEDLLTSNSTFLNISLPT